MKKRLLLGISAILLLVPMVVFTQQESKKEPVTKLEQFLAKKGKLILKDSQNAGILQGQYGTKITVDAIAIYEPGSEKDKIRGLRIEVYEGGRLERSNTSFLDMDEVQSLSQAIEYMTTLLEKWRDSNREYTEVIFSTKGEFILGFYQKGNKVNAFSKSGTIGAASCYFNTNDLSQLQTIIDKGNTLLTK